MSQGFGTPPQTAQSGSRDWIDAFQGAPLWLFGDSLLTESDGGYKLGEWLRDRNNFSSLSTRAGAGSGTGLIVEQIRDLASGAGAVLFGVAIVDGGVNNVSSSHTVPTVKEGFRSIFANLTFEARETYAAASFSFGSGWTNGVTTTPGSKVNRKWTGDTNYVAMKFTTGADVIWAVKDSGGNVLETFNTGGYSEQFTGHHKLSGFGSGTHEVTLTLESGAGGTIYGALIPNPDPMTVFWLVVGDVKNFSGPQNILLASYNAAVETLLADFPTVVPVAADGWDPDWVVTSDNTHWNWHGVNYWVNRVEEEGAALSVRQGQNVVTVSTAPSYSVPTASAPSGGGSAPANTVAPAITGTAETGQVLTCSTGTWTGTATITYARQWKRNGSNISGATSSTYTLQVADEGTTVKCTVTATNGIGSTSADSNTVTPAAAAGGGTSYNIKTWNRDTDKKYIYGIDLANDLPVMNAGDTVVITSPSSPDWIDGTYTVSSTAAHFTMGEIDGEAGGTMRNLVLLTVSPTGTGGALDAGVTGGIATI